MTNDLALFSINEDLDEISTADLRYSGTLLLQLITGFKNLAILIIIPLSASILPLMRK